MRNWILFAFVVAVLSAVGCTSDVHAAIRDEHGHPGPTADTGVLPKNPQGNYGGDAAGTLNLDANHEAKTAGAGKAADRNGDG